MRLVTILICAFLAFASATQSAPPAADTLYDAATDSAMHYLDEHGPDFRTTLILQECGLTDLAARTAKRLPDSVAWFKASNEAAGVPTDQLGLTAQIARGYLLGFEAGTRLEFERAPDAWRLANCNA